MPILVCHIGWMHRYEGLEHVPGDGDTIEGGGKWIYENGYGGEVCNFLKCADGFVYGHFETVKNEIIRKVNLEKLGSAPEASSVSGVDVVWTATEPEERGRRIVGWYKDAEIFRLPEKFQTMPSAQHALDELKTFRVRAKANNAILLAPGDRTIRLGRGHGWIGQANWWYPERSNNLDVLKFMRRVQHEIDSTKKISVPVLGKSSWGGGSDPERNAEVERRAIETVVGYYAGCDVWSVEKENKGWDLEAVRKGQSTPVECIEVKGLSGSELIVGLTPREYQAFAKHIKGQMPHYRLCVVREALSNAPRLVVFRYIFESRTWRDEVTGSEIHPNVNVVEAAIVSL